MPLFFKRNMSEHETPRISVDELVPKAQAYIEMVQGETNKPAKTPGVQHQILFPDDGPKFSARDNYSSADIRSVLKSGTRNADTDWSLLNRDLGSYLNVGFVEKMETLLRERNLKDSAVYKAAQIDRRLFSKIMSDRSYKPAKDTCVSIGLALKLSLAEAEDLLSRAGYTLSHSNKRDVILEFCFIDEVYDINTVNDLLFNLGQKILGR